MKKGKLVSAKVYYLENNQRQFYKPINVGMRCSLWVDETNFTASEWREIDHVPLMPGGEAVVNMMTLSSKIWERVKVGDEMYWGVPYTYVGKLEVLSIEDVEEE